MSVRTEVTVVRLYYKSPLSQTLRKSAAAELAHLVAAGWQEKNRKPGVDHVVVRLERPVLAQPSLPTASGGGGGGGGRPRR
jgi:hypothetical protein